MDVPLLVDGIVRQTMVLIAQVSTASGQRAPLSQHGLLWLAYRHLAGRRGRFDGLFGGLGRGNAMNSHLQAGTPHPDDLAVPIPPRRPRRPRRSTR